MRALAVLAMAVLSTSCGYRVSSHTNALPSHIKSIAIPAFANASSRYRLSDSLPSALSREFLTRTRYHVASDVNEADAVLRGTVSNILLFPTVVDLQSNRSTGVQVIVYLQLSLTDRKSGATLYQVPNMEVRQRYEIAVDPNAYFEESDVAMERLSRDVAQTVVSAVLEKF